MGATLAGPITSKLVMRVSGPGFRIGSAEMQGYRTDMEDEKSVQVELPGHPGLTFIGVYDGHAGKSASKFLAQTLHTRFAASRTPVARDTIEEVCLATDAEFLSKPEKTHGSACVFAMVRPVEDGRRAWRVVVGNVGDSRAIIARRDGTCVSLTSDHKGDLPAEKARIVAAGGTVSDGRTDGSLAMSRAFGDWEYKNNPALGPRDQKVIAVPDITEEMIYPGDILILCCDGLVESEHQTNESVIAFVHQHRNLSGDPGALAMALLDDSVTAGSKDNHTAVVMSFAENVDGSFELPDSSFVPLGEVFVPGPFQPYSSDEEFVKAYMSDAARHGYGPDKVAELMAKAAEAEKTMPSFPVQENILSTARFLSMVQSIQRASTGVDESPPARLSGFEAARACASCGARGGALSACSRCGLVFYCNSSCQRADWSEHKLVCVNKAPEGPFPPPGPSVVRAKAAKAKRGKK
eukprot:gnl/Spiro4/13963_TR7474_c0_g1_i1.p1 gnl/Spiro4/13963_TR7474_c0_g1~~gnl/Spiro4/13963_TR7474_c0_g1_i1.p1  ORF type:complete len:475 (-),score=85.36 gnl/Spiro4/13963_TR7474_c0_g1_i1:91-1485(-)